MLRYILLSNLQNSNRYTEWTRQDLLAFILPSLVHTRGLSLFAISEKSGNQIWREEGITHILNNAQSNAPNVFYFCFALLNINSFDCCPNHRYMASFTISSILGQSLPRLDKTSDPERDSEPNELVAEAFRENLCLSSYPLLAKCCFLLV